jgi:DNA-binding IclR family transcriptional regulator
LRKPSDGKSSGGRTAGTGIQVINRAARILRSLRDEPAGLSLGQIADRVDLPRSTVQRIVGALVVEHLLMHASPGGRVRLGSEIATLAAGSKIDIVELAHPHLKALSESTGETVDLAMLREDHLVFVDQVVGSHRLRAVSAVGEVFPLHSTANGKACLALFDEAEIRRRFGRTLAQACRSEGRPMKDLLAEVSAIRRSGVAVDEEEHSAGISAVGTAFLDPLGVAYAISIPMPTSRFAGRRERLAGLLLKTRDRLSGLLNPDLRQAEPRATIRP